MFVMYRTVRKNPFYKIVYKNKYLECNTFQAVFTGCCQQDPCFVSNKACFLIHLLTENMQVTNLLNIIYQPLQFAVSEWSKFFWRSPFGFQNIFFRQLMPEIEWVEKFKMGQGNGIFFFIGTFWPVSSFQLIHGLAEVRGVIVSSQV